MKQAQVIDTWRRVLKRPYKATYKNLSFTGNGRLGSGDVSFDAGITVVIGGNGVGKSTLMGTLLRSLGPIQDRRISRMFGETAAMTINGILAVEEKLEVRTSLDDVAVKVSPVGAALPSYAWIDPSTYATEIRDLILQDANFLDNLQGIGPQIFGEDECDAISYIVGRKYESIEVYEIAEYGQRDDVIPFFRVKVNGISYDSMGMGLGELSLLLIYWRLRGLANETIVFIEEPETHVSPRSQENLMDVCMALSLKKGLSLIVTTHSPFLIAKVPRARLRLLLRGAGNVEVVSNPGHDQVARVLGDRLTYHGAILVEDELARSVVRSLLRLLSPDLLEYFEVVVAGSNDAIVKGIDGLPRLKSWFSLVGVFDGDQRAEQEGKAHVWPHLFLPGEDSPEQLMRPVIEGRRAAFADSVGCSVQLINIACEVAGGEEFHDWLISIRQTLGLDIQGLSDRVVQVWLQDPANRGKCEDFLKGLRNLAFLIQQPITQAASEQL